MENNLVRDGGGGGVSGLDGLASVVRDVGARPANDPLPGQTFAENVDWTSIENVKSVNWLIKYWTMLNQLIDWLSIEQTFLWEIV